MSRRKDYTIWGEDCHCMELQVICSIFRFAQFELFTVWNLSCNYGMGPALDSFNNKLDRIDERSQRNKEKRKYIGLLPVHFHMVFWDSFLLPLQRL